MSKPPHLAALGLGRATLAAWLATLDAVPLDPAEVRAIAAQLREVIAAADERAAMSSARMARLRPFDHGKRYPRFAYTATLRYVGSDVVLLTKTGLDMVAVAELTDGAAATIRTSMSRKQCYSRVVPEAWRHLPKGTLHGPGDRKRDGIWFITRYRIGTEHAAPSA